jgi:hypothetical protein
MKKRVHLSRRLNQQKNQRRKLVLNQKVLYTNVELIIVDVEDEDGF